MSSYPLHDLPRASAPALTWHDRWVALRNRLLASPVFQRRAAAFVLTRPVARHRAESLFTIVAGFVYSQILLACVRLDLFERLAAGPRTAEELAPQLGLAPAACDRLLAAAASLRLVQRCSGGRFALGVLGAPLVGNRALTAMIEHHAALYADLADPVALLRAPEGQGGERLAGYWAYATTGAPQGLPAEQVAAYSGLMSASQPLVADQLLAAYSLDRHRCLLDIGGGEGTFLLRVAAHAPHLQLMLFDLPAVAARAQARFDAAGLAGRAQAVGGSFRQDALPHGADIATLVRVVHDHDDATVLTVMRAARTALVPGGTLLVAEQMAGTAGAEAMGDAYFGFFLLAMGSGRPRTVEEIGRLMSAAGFEDIRALPTRLPLQARVIQARAPLAH